MQILYFILVALGIVFFYSLMIGITRAIAVRAFDTKNWEEGSLEIASFFWMFLLPAWICLSLIYIGIHCVPVWISRLGSLIIGFPEQKIKIIEAKPTPAKVLPMKKRKKKDKNPRSGKELGIYDKRD